MPIPATEQFTNNAASTLSAAITSTSATTLTVTSAAAFPAAPQFRILIDSELLLVTGVSGTTFTVTRNVEGTSAATHLISAPVTHVVTAGSLQGWSPSLNPLPRSHKLLAWNYDPIAANSGVICVSGTIYALKIPVPVDISVTNIIFNVTVAGATLTSGQNLVGLYSQTGAQIGVSADQSASWVSAALKTIALTGGPFTVTGGPDAFCYVLLMSNGTTPISSPRGALNQFTLNANLAAADGYRFATQATGATALPASFTVSALAITTMLSFWVGLS